MMIELDYVVYKFSSVIFFLWREFHNNTRILFIANSENTENITM